MTGEFYILKGKKVVTVKDVLVWGKWFQENDRRVAETTIGRYWVSTVFLGIDCNFSMRGKPLVFETMVFDRESKKKYKLGEKEIESIGEEADVDRYSTWEEAETGHKKMVEKWRKK